MPHRSYGIRFVLAVLLLGIFMPETGLAQQETARKVSSAAELTAQIEAGGGTIVLEGGSYGLLDLRESWPAGSPLVLRSADPQNPAVFSELKIHSARNIVLQGLVFDYDFTPGDSSDLAPFRIGKSHGIKVQGCLFDGDIAYGTNTAEDGYGSSTGFKVRHSSDIQVENSVFRKLKRGLLISQTTDVVIRNNNIHSLRMDGMNFAEVRNVLIERNHIHGFKGRPGWEDHRDMIQFWTAGTQTPTRNVVIRDNVLNSANGSFTQSIFMRNELVDTGKAGPEMFYRDIQITENVIINAHLHGITVGETRGLRITNNTIVRNARSEGEKENINLWKPRIRLKPTSRNVEVLRNVTGALDGPEGQTDWKVADNLLVQDHSRNKAGFYTQVFVPQSIRDPRRIEAFSPRPGGPLDGSGIGAGRMTMPIPQVPN